VRGWRVSGCLGWRSPWRGILLKQPWDSGVVVDVVSPLFSPSLVKRVSRRGAGVRVPERGGRLECSEPRVEGPRLSAEGFGGSDPSRAVPFGHPAVFKELWMGVPASVWGPLPSF